MSILWVILCCLQEKGRREIVEEMKERDRGERKMNDSEEKEIEEIVKEMKEQDRGERKMNDSEETDEIKTFPLYRYLLQG